MTPSSERAYRNNEFIGGLASLAIIGTAADLDKLSVWKTCNLPSVCHHLHRKIGGVNGRAVNDFSWTTHPRWPRMEICCRGQGVFSIFAADLSLSRLCGHHHSQQTRHQRGVVANPWGIKSAEKGMIWIFSLYPVRAWEFDVASKVRLSQPAFLLNTWTECGVHFSLPFPAMGFYQNCVTDGVYYR